MFLKTNLSIKEDLSDIGWPTEYIRALQQLATIHRRGILCTNLGVDNLVCDDGSVYFSDLGESAVMVKTTEKGILEFLPKTQNDNSNKENTLKGTRNITKVLVYPFPLSEGLHLVKKQQIKKYNIKDLEMLTKAFTRRLTLQVGKIEKVANQFGEEVGVKFLSKGLPKFWGSLRESRAGFTLLRCCVGDEAGRILRKRSKHFGEAVRGNKGKHQEVSYL